MNSHSKRSNTSSDQISDVSLNQKVKQYRLKKNYTIKELAHQTKISVSFIKGVEEKKYTYFPSLAYSSGLLTNILEFLQVPSDEIEQLISDFEHDLSSLSQQKDQPKNDIPIKRDLKSQVKDPDLTTQESTYKSSNYLVLTVIVLVAILIFLFLTYQEKLKIISTDGQSKNNFALSSIDANGEKKRLIQAYSLYEGSRTYTLGKGDEIRVFFQNNIVIFKVEEVSLENPLSIKLVYQNDQYVMLSLFQEILVNLNQDDKKDLLIKFQQISGDLAIIYFSLIDENFKNIDYAEIWNQQDKLIVDENEHLLIKNENKSVIVSYIKATTLPIHLSYNIDGQRQNIINLKPGNQISILAQNHLEIQIGNYRSAQLVINRLPIQLITQDQDQFSVTKIIKWVPNPNNETLFDLMIKNFIN